MAFSKGLVVEHENYEFNLKTEQDCYFVAVGSVRGSEFESHIDSGGDPNCLLNLFANIATAIVKSTLRNTTLPKQIVVDAVTEAFEQGIATVNEEGAYENAKAN